MSGKVNRFLICHHTRLVCRLPTITMALRSTSHTIEPQATTPAPKVSSIRTLVTSDLSRPEWFINRELSLLEFNRRVLDLAKDPKVLCWNASNTSASSVPISMNFFEVRVAGLKEQGHPWSRAAWGRRADAIGAPGSHRRAHPHQLVQEQYVGPEPVADPETPTNAFGFWERADWMPSHIRWMRRFFSRELLPLLSPVGLDPASVSENCSIKFELSGDPGRDRRIPGAPTARPSSRFRGRSRA